MLRVILCSAFTFLALGCTPSNPDASLISEEHAVIVRFDYGKTDLDPLFELERRLENAINESKVGEYDGNEIAVDGSDGTLYMYGPNGDSLLSVIQPIIESIEFMNGANITVRYGPPEDGVTQREITIGK